MKTILFTASNGAEQAEITIVRSNKKYVALQPADSRHLTLLVPESFTDKDIENVLREQQAWIESCIQKVRKHEKEVQGGTRLSVGEVNNLCEKAGPVMMPLVNEYMPVVRVNVRRLCIDVMRRRWVSCTARGVLTLNGLLVQAPDHVRRYVVVQGLCQLLGKYNPALRPEPSQFLPDCQNAEKWLKTEGRKLLSMLPEGLCKP